ncbi:hypothetical protein [Nocardia gamkensis]|uniref:Uncharacterized protein n=1 Tax=Nocardia gamkensis TaxID=352869 RepID=A0A7X6L4T7_9NOCA|nr:hypothetical protein [Nocardia gamkensis]NKY27740.1 hypothetical protein [Nocardia gamkensis]
MAAPQRRLPFKSGYQQDGTGGKNVNEPVRQNLTSSIGAVWPPAFATHNRLRGFYPRVVDTADAMIQFIEDFEDYRAKAAYSSIDRLTIRYAGSIELLYMLEDAGIEVEGVIPLACEHPHYIVYTCWHSSFRSIGADDLLQHRIILKRTRKERARKNRIATDSQALGLTIHVLSRGTELSRREHAVARFVEVYRTFGLDQHGVRDLVLSADNTIAYLADSSDAVVCTVLAERAKILIEGHDALVLFEITEGTTRVDFQGRGLYRGLSALLVDHVWEEATEPIHAIYGESNLSSPGVIYAARQNGRRFVHDEGHLYGAIHSRNLRFGILSQNYKVNDGREKRAYNDFALSYVDLAERRL